RHLSLEPRRAARALLSGFPSRAHLARPAGRRAHLRADARADERDLFRARLPGALPRLSHGRGRGLERARRRRLCAHRFRPAADRGVLRRIDADFADPLELNAASRLGAPGLLQAVRDGKVIIANALGAGLVEARAMLAFLPALARSILGAELAIPNVATWWLGQADVREEVIEKLDRLVIAQAFESHVDERSESGVLGAKLDEAQREALIRSIRSRGVDYVAREAVTLSSRFGAMGACNRGRLRCAFSSTRSPAAGRGCPAALCASPEPPPPRRPVGSERPRRPMPAASRAAGPRGPAA